MDNLTTFEQICIQQSNREFCLNIIVAIITFISVISVYLDYRNRKNKERAEKSINIAEEFANSIIPKIALLNRLFSQEQLSKIINKVKFINYLDFDNEEVNELYSKEDIQEYKKILEGINLSTYENEPILDAESFIVLLLNELEHMCMYISTKVADEKYIYNSLHQQFFKAISMLYISISLINVDNKNKYYTNIITVFNMWKDKYIKFEKKEKRLKKKLHQKTQPSNYSIK